MENERIAPKESLVSMGAKLKSAREGKALTIDQVQKQTHIYSRILVALEEGRCDDILPATYVKSFLKKYSHYLGLDSNDFIKKYMAAHPEEAYKKTPDITFAEVKRPDLFLKFIYIISFILLVAAFLSITTFLGKKVISSFKKAKTVKTAIAYKPSPKEPVKTPVPKKVPLNLTLKVKQRVRVQVKKDGVVLFGRILPKGAVESLTADDKIEIYVAKAEAIELILNGKSLGSPGKGVIKNLEITSKGIKIK